METSSERSNANLHKEIAKSFVLVNCIQKMLELYDELFEKVEDLRPDIEYVFKRKTLVIQEMKQFARFEEEKMFLSCSHKKI